MRRRWPFSGLFLFLAVLLFALQAVPLLGRVLMGLGAPFITGLLVNAALLSMLVEAAFRRIPRWLIVVPIPAYGGYAALYAVQAWQVAAKSAELNAGNPRLVLPDDPGAHALVGEQAPVLVKTYDVPVVFAPSSAPEGYHSYRLAERQPCSNTPRIWQGF